jgi:hypothetical protein
MYCREAVFVKFHVVVVSVTMISFGLRTLAIPDLLTTILTKLSDVYSKSRLNSNSQSLMSLMLGQTTSPVITELFAEWILSYELSTRNLTG